jgi:hypothetical protein
VRPLTRPWLGLAIAVALVALPTVASAAHSSQTANSTTFSDSTGEDPAAPDITTIVASNDDAGSITFRVNVPNRPQLTQDIAAFLDIDSDANAATGDPDNFGADHIIQYLLGEAILFKWDGSDYRVSATQASLTSSWASGPTFRINASELNNTRRLTFGTLVVSGIVFDQTTGAIDCTNCKRDLAPVIGFYSYNVMTTRPTLVAKGLKATPRVPVAGRPFTLRLVAARSDTGAVVQNGRVTCVGRVGSARLKAQVQRVQGGAAVCTWNVPGSAKGKSFRGSVSVVFEGLKASQSYAGKVR